MRLFVPLQVAFEEEIKEKDEVIQEYEKAIKSLKTRATSLVNENQDLILKLDKFASAAAVDPEQHIMLTENSTIILNENELLKDKVGNAQKRYFSH